MSLEKAKEFLEKKGLADRIKFADQSTATVALAAEALGVEEGQIAKTLSFYLEDKPILILAAGTARIKNRKFKDTFGKKPKMIPAKEVEEAVGHAPGGVCPFGVKSGVKIYLDKSLKAYDTVYPAAGTDNTGVKLTPEELDKALDGPEWIDVCEGPKE